MKNRIKIYPIFVFILLFLTFGCNEDEILKEVPLDFAAPENAFVTVDDYNIAVAALYDLAREELAEDEGFIIDYQYGTDAGVANTPHNGPFFSYYPAHLTSSAGFVREHWARYYKLISTANIILNRMQDSELTDAQKANIEGKARFFRGLAYKNLAHLYGGVPIELEEVGSPKTDYTRASREAVYQQAVSDLEFAAQNLGGIDEVDDWEVNNLAAYHLLSEVYITLEEWSSAIQAATVVINDPNTALMTERFGTRSSEPGDVYWDLFRRGNQNRSSGNTEAIMVWQFEIDVLGGIQESSSSTQPRFERNWVPFAAQLSAKGPDGVTPFLAAPASDYTGGRGIGRIRPTVHYMYEVWRDDWNDMRNSNYNFVRDWKFNNPKSQWYGEWLIAEHSDWWPPSSPDDSIRWLYPYPTKVTTPYNHPDGLFADKSIWKLTNSAGTTYADWYFIRLAETFLLRAEAFLGNGEPGKAAADINVVRSRANASSVTAAEVDVDYILDERLRELGPEEPRRITLQRLGLLYDRVNRYGLPSGFRGNDEFQLVGFGVQPHNNLWPIPFSEIERNTDAVLEQNPGYAAE